jgi:hypothetical protein
MLASLGTWRHLVATRMFRGARRIQIVVVQAREHIGNGWFFGRAGGMIFRWIAVIMVGDSNNRSFHGRSQNLYRTA